MQTMAITIMNITNNNNIIAIAIDCPKLLFYGKHAIILYTSIYIYNLLEQAKNELEVVTAALVLSARHWLVVPSG